MARPAKVRPTSKERCNDDVSTNHHASCWRPWSLAAPVHGQEAAPPPLAPQYVDEQAGVTLDTAIARALEREPSLRAVRDGHRRRTRTAAAGRPAPESDADVRTPQRTGRYGQPDQRRHSMAAGSVPPGRTRADGRARAAGDATRRHRSRTIAGGGRAHAVRRCRRGGPGGGHRR